MLNLSIIFLAESRPDLRKNIPVKIKFDNVNINPPEKKEILNINPYNTYIKNEMNNNTAET
jgi:hypothetical protein